MEPKIQLPNQPLADRMRPKSLDEYSGQEHLVGKGAVIRTMVESGSMSSFILWGPPGVGKTTLAKIISHQLNRPFYSLSAINSGVKDVRETIEKARKQQFFNQPNPVLFIDEIHRFSKSQQDSLLGAVEAGIITLIGATTENPSFEVISPLLSRCQVYILNSLDKDQLIALVNKALKEDSYLKKLDVHVLEYEAMLQYSGGDARKLYNTLELVIRSELSDEVDEIEITNDKVKERLQENIAVYDKNGELHYDIISAFIKSIRGGDPDAAVYWLARMLDGGEDIKFIARRLVILAAEDIGLANPNALLMANSCFQSIHVIGMPEARIILSETAIYLATSPKSNSAYSAINAALAHVKQTGNLPVPLHLRNAPTKLMKDIGYGKDYKYAHSYEGNFVSDQFLPDGIKNQQFYIPGSNSRENEIRKTLENNWKDKKKYDK
ncbi:MAG: replication-associated recombination protein A [Bacteroidales bacterium]|nr:replication-associated recombination protein A [Bacteroidales bacterium]MDT8430903.1 replication-associated recombination protein A [Bacteroidales bacterium]